MGKVRLLSGEWWGESKDLKITPNWSDQKVLRASKDPEEKGLLLVPLVPDSLIPSQVLNVCPMASV